MPRPLGYSGASESPEVGEVEWKCTGVLFQNCVGSPIAQLERTLPGTSCDVTGIIMIKVGLLFLKALKKFRKQNPLSLEEGHDIAPKGARGKRTVSTPEDQYAHLGILLYSPSFLSTQDSS